MVMHLSNTPSTEESKRQKWEDPRANWPTTKLNPNGKLQIICLSNRRLGIIEDMPTSTSGHHMDRYMHTHMHTTRVHTHIYHKHIQIHNKMKNKQCKHCCLWQYESWCKPTLANLWLFCLDASVFSLLKINIYLKLAFVNSNRIFSGSHFLKFRFIFI